MRRSSWRDGSQTRRNCWPALTSTASTATSGTSAWPRARGLHKHLTKKVRDQVFLALNEAKADGSPWIDIGTIGLGALIALLAGPAAAAAALRGITLENVTARKVMLEDMPDDVATQMCNTFAKDRADETDAPLWEDPGEGLAVAPDDIKAFWDAPDASTTSLREWKGLYGHSEALLLTPWRMEVQSGHKLARSPGPAYVVGQVRYQGNPIEGAYVRFGCESTMTTGRSRFEPSYALAVSAGEYEVVASAYWPTTKQQLTGRRVVRLEAGDQPGPIDIDLEDPPEWRRLVRCTGKIDTVRRVVVGEDDWAHAGINDQAFLTWAPDTWGEPPAGTSVTSWENAFIGNHAQRFNVRVDVKLTLREDLAMDAIVRSTLCQNYYRPEVPPTPGRIVTTKQKDPFVVQPGQKQSMSFHHNSGNFPPDRGYVELAIENLISPA